MFQERYVLKEGEGMKRWRLGRILVFLFVTVFISGSISAFASDGQWNSVIRPGVNAGTGTADYTVEMLSPLYQNASSMLFFNPRFRINPGLNDEDEYNLGLGYRRLILNDNWYLGGNVFYDSMSSANDFDYHQVGLGVEARSKWLDVILNGYIQTGKTKHRLTSYDTFSLGSHALMRHDGYEEAMSGMDGEVGVLVPFISDYVETRAYVGGYWWVSDVASDVTGFRARVQVDPVPLLTMNAIYSNDNIRNSVWRGEAYLNIPFSFENVVHGKNPFAGIKDALKFGKGPRDARERMTDRVERDRYIQTKVASSSSSVAVHDMIYVNNANTSGTQDGSLQHPYSTLAGAAAVINANNNATLPYIYIFKGNGSYTDGLWLLNNLAQIRSYMIWGEGYTLPGLSSAGNPVLTTNGISFYGEAYAGDLTVRGLTVDGASGDGLYAARVRKADIYDNVFSHNGGSGIHINTTYSPATTDDVDINIHGNTANSNGANGINCTAINMGVVGGNVNVTISGNTANDNGSDNIYAYAENYVTGDGSTTLNITGNEASGSTGGPGTDNIYAYANNEATGDGSTNMTVSDNQASGSTDSYGIDAEAYRAYNGSGTSGDVNVTVSGNKANDNSGDNIYAYADNEVSGAGSTSMSVSGNQASGSTGSYGIDAEAYRAYNGSGTSGDVNVTVSGNTANDNSGDNIYAYAENDATGDGTATLTVTGNQASGSAGGAGIDAEAYRAYNGSGTSGDVNMTVSGNTANGNISYNIYADAENDAAGDGSTTVTVSNNKASGSTSGYGIYADVFNSVGGSGNASLDLSNNTATGNSSDDVFADVESYATVSPYDVYFSGSGNTFGVFDTSSDSTPDLNLHSDWGIIINTFQP